MTFIEHQQKILIDALSTLTIIKSYTEMLRTATTDLSIELNGEQLSIHQAKYAEIMKELIRAYVPAELQMNNARQLSNMEVVELFSEIA